MDPRVAIGMVDENGQTVTILAGNHVPAVGDEILLCDETTSRWTVLRRVWKVSRREAATVDLIVRRAAPPP